MDDFQTLIGLQSIVSSSESDRKCNAGYYLESCIDKYGRTLAVTDNVAPPDLSNKGFVGSVASQSAHR